MSMQRKAQSEPFCAAAFPAASPSAGAFGESLEAGMGPRAGASGSVTRRSVPASVRTLTAPQGETGLGMRGGWAGLVPSSQYI